MSKETLESFKELVKRVKDMICKPLKDLDAEMWWSEEPLPFEERMSGSYRQLKVTLLQAGWCGKVICLIYRLRQ